MLSSSLYQFSVLSSLHAACPVSVLYACRGRASQSCPELRGVALALYARPFCVLVGGLARADRAGVRPGARHPACARSEGGRRAGPASGGRGGRRNARQCRRAGRSEEHTSELQSLMRISYAVFCLKKKKNRPTRLQIKNNTRIRTNKPTQQSNEHNSHTEMSTT